MLIGLSCALLLGGHPRGMTEYGAFCQDMNSRFKVHLSTWVRGWFLGVKPCPVFADRGVV